MKYGALFSLLALFALIGTVGALSYGIYSSARVPITMNPPSDCGILPSGAVGCLPFTLTSSVSTSADFQQFVQFDADTYVTHLSGDLHNIAFYNVTTGARLYAWCEANCTNTSTLSQWWVLVPEPFTSDANLAIAVYPKSTNEYASGYTGEAPQLSGTYGANDNGASVFDFYDNFAGTTLSGVWNVGVATAIVNDGLTYSTSTPSFSNDGMWTTVSVALPAILDTYIAHSSTQYGCAGISTQGDADATTAGDAGLLFITSGAAGNPGKWLFGSPVATSSTTVGNIYSDTYYVASISETPSVAAETLDGLTETQTSLSLNPMHSAFTGHPGCNAGSGVATIHAYWTRIRDYPPSGTMPTVAMGTPIFTTTTSTTSSTTSSSTTSSSTTTSSTTSSSTSTSQTTTSWFTTSSTTSIPYVPNTSTIKYINTRNATGVAYTFTYTLALPYVGVGLVTLFTMIVGLWKRRGDLAVLAGLVSGVLLEMLIPSNALIVTIAAFAVLMVFAEFEAVMKRRREEGGGERIIEYRTRTVGGAGREDLRG